MITRATLDQLTSAIMAELAGSPDLMSELMAETGLQPGDLRRLAADRSDDLAAALLDFICAADSRLEQFAANAGWQPDKVAYARAALENGQIR